MTDQLATILDAAWDARDGVSSATQGELRDAVQTALAQLDSADAWQAPLIDTLADTRLAEPNELPATGVPAEVEHALSSPFVQMPQRAYGTRSSTLLRWHADGRLQVDEWTHEPGSAAPPFAPPTRRRDWLSLP